MNILILHKWMVIGGVEKILLNYLSLFQKNKHNIDILLSYDIDDNYLITDIPSSIKYEFILDKSYINKEKILSSKKRKNIINKLKYELFKFNRDSYIKRKFINKINTHQYDLIIDFSGVLDKIIRNKRLLSQLKTPTIRWVHGQLNGGNSLSDKQIAKYKKIFSHHDAIISICPQMIDIITETLEIGKEKFITIFNPIDLEYIHKKSLEFDTLLPPKSYLLQVSRLVGGKGHEELIKIYSKLKENSCNYKLVFIGDGENRKNLEGLIKQYHLENDCILLGEIINPYPYFRNAKLFLHTSEHEGLPTVLLESMALGVPVVAMDCPTGPRDILGKNSEFGKLIPLHDKDEFISSVLSLLNNDDIYNSYVQQSLLRIQDFSTETIEIELEKLLNSVVNNNL